MQHDDHADHYLAPHAALSVSQRQGPSLSEGGHGGPATRRRLPRAAPGTIAWGRTYETLNGRRMVPTHYWVIWYYKGARPGRGQLPCPLQGVPGWSLQGHGHRRQDTGLRRD